VLTRSGMLHLLVAASACQLFISEPAAAQSPDIVVPLGTTLLLTIPDGVERIVVGDSSIADVVVVSGSGNREILVNGKKNGFTNFYVWPNRGPARPYRLEVASNPRNESVAVRVQVIEATERRNGAAGIRWNDVVGFSEASPNAPFRFGLPIRNDVLKATLQTLAVDRDINVLAAPTLVIQNGKKGSFLAGGEVPVPLMQTTGGGVAYTVEWKQFGVKLDVEPRLEGANDIVLRLKPEVSSVDAENAIQLRDLSVPGFSTRSAETTVTLREGESLVLAGLLRKDRIKTISKLPVLGDIPLLGNLFGSTQYDERASELVFIVTPSVVTRNPVLPESEYGKGRPGQRSK